MILVADSEFKTLIPTLSPEEYAGLEASILAEGCRDALVVWQGIIIDGYNRYEICQRHGIPFKVIEREFKDRAEAVNWIIDNQLSRRNLTPEQRLYLVGKRYKGEKKVWGGDRKSEDVKSRGQNGPLIRTYVRLAEGHKIGVTTVKRAERFADAVDALDDALGIRQRILSGNSKMTQKDVLSLAKAEPDKQKEIYTLVESGRAKNISQASIVIAREKLRERLKENAGNGSNFTVEAGDIKTHVFHRQFDFIITDPPYPKEFLPLYEILAMRATEWLKPTGLLITLNGQSYLNEVIELLSRHLEYYWTACLLLPGQATPLWQKQVNSNWKPVLVYKLKGEKYTGKIFGDVFTSDAPDKNYHHWGQSVSGMLSLIKQICLPGQSILDPFCGGGSVGVAALMHGCNFYGLDINKENVLITQGRLNDTEKV